VGLEVTQFRKNVRAWLLAIDGMAARVAARVYSNWPMQPPTYPMLTFALERSPAMDHPGPAWAGTLTVEAHDPSEDERDAIENLITQDLQDSGTAILTALSTSGAVLCTHFALTSIAADDVYQDVREEGAYLVGSRRLEFAFLIVAQGE